MSLHELIISAQNLIRLIILDRSDCGLNTFSTLVFEFFYLIAFIEVFRFDTDVSFDLITNRNGYWMLTT